jgi:hypothetical protein
MSSSFSIKLKIGTTTHYIYISKQVPMALGLGFALGGLMTFYFFINHILVAI